jgi:hypothetical protein
MRVGHAAQSWAALPLALPVESIRATKSRSEGTVSMGSAELDQIALGRKLVGRRRREMTKSDAAGARKRQEKTRSANQAARRARRKSRTR